jgi:hypothetical protein
MIRKERASASTMETAQIEETNSLLSFEWKSKSALLMEVTWRAMLSIKARSSVVKVDKEVCAG